MRADLATPNFPRHLGIGRPFASNYPPEMNARATCSIHQLKRVNSSDIARQRRLTADSKTLKDTAADSEIIFLGKVVPRIGVFHWYQTHTYMS